MKMDIELRRDFTNNVPKNEEEIVQEMMDTHFTNINEGADELLYYSLAGALWNDLKYKQANYRAYLTRGMNFRWFMELRKSALLNAPCDEFYRLHQEATELQHVKDLRIAYLAPEFNKFIWNGYRDDDWQLYMVIHWTTTSEYRNFFWFDFDMKNWLMDTPKGYECKNYMEECMRFYTDYDMLGRPRKKPIDISMILRMNGYM